MSTHISNRPPRIVGMISEGTLRPEDTIPTFMQTLRELSPVRHALLVDQHSKLLDNLADGDYEDVMNLLTRVWDEINNVIPEGWYFGAHEGDGACFGIWRVEDAE